MTLALVVLGGGLGAVLRFLVDRAVTRHTADGLPWGTLGVNAIGSFVLGVVLGAAHAGALSTEVVTLLAAGLCGGLTTFSTFAYETVRLAEQQRWRAALGNVAVSVVAGVALAALGYGVGGLAG